MTTTDNLAEALRKAINGGCMWYQGRDLVEAEQTLAAYEAEMAEREDLVLSGCKDHQGDSKNLSCLAIRKLDGTRLTMREIAQHLGIQKNKESSECESK